MKTDTHHAQTVTMDSCCCHHHHHDHEHSHPHDCHSHQAAARAYLAPVFSFLLLVVGIVLQHTGAAWFGLQGIQLCWFIVAFLPVGVPVIREAWESVKDKDVFSEFTLMVIASVGAFCIGEYPEAVAVMLFYTVGETLQHKAVDRATRNISNLLDVRPEHAAVLRNGTYVQVAPATVKPGEQIEIKPGERIPLDGTLVEDEGLFDTAALTGESVPRTIGRGEEVLAGMIANGRTVHLTVNRPYEQSALARILSLVKDAAGRKASAELFIRRFARVYTPIVIVLAFLIVAVPAVLGLMMPAFDYVFADWLYRGLVFLVISCPCALVISVPLGYFAGIGVASRSGILFKGGNYLDAITRVNSIAFDKTGTLTTGKFHVSHLQAEGIAEEQLLSFLLSAEAKSTHPIAQAIAGYVRQKGIAPAPVECMEEVSGHGVKAMIGGKELLVGNARLMNEHHIALPASAGHTAATTIYCAIDGRYVGYLTLADSLKEDAPDAIARLKALGINRLCLLSGDKPELAEAYARTLGIAEAHGGLLPEDKARYVEQEAARPGSCVAFVGDGMNDAPVLALSHVGIAMGGLGSDAAIESADVVIQTDQPSKVATAIRIGRTTRSIVHQNIVGAIGIKVIVLLAGALGFASLWMAVFADVGVALLAVLNSVRIFGKRFA